jgi:ceramidase
MGRIVHNPCTYVDLYCERLAPGLFGEPLNTLSNAAFLFAAWLLVRDARRLGAWRPDTALLVALVVAVGIGSTAFHMLATTAAQWLDVIPILLFQLVFLWIYTQRALHWRAIASGALLAAFFALCFYARELTAPLNGSLGYAPALVALFALGLHEHAVRGNEPPLLLIAAAVFAVSLGLRTVDIAACDHLPHGTHLFWHLLNGVVVYLSGRALLGTVR